MGILSWFFGRKVTATWLEPGDGDFEIVGEGSYQDALERIAGGRTEEGVQHPCDARLQPEKNNPHDAKAVRVTIEGQTVGYLSREHAAEYRGIFGSTATYCEAEIVGGWDRGKRGQGHFGVKLDIEWPPRIGS